MDYFSVGALGPVAQRTTSPPNAERELVCAELYASSGSVSPRQTQLSVFNVVVVPLRLKLPKLHSVKLAQQPVGFEQLNYRRRIHRKGKSVVSYLATVS
jgi:hypothetical protein